jgi:sulfur-oxidizing protein SoxY
MTAKPPSAPTRRLVLVGAAALCLPNLAPRTASATPDSMAAAMRAVTGEVTVTPGKVKLELPPLVENGNTVPFTVSVESPMTPSAYVKAIHLFNEKNPQPNVISARLGPRAGKAMISGRMRLADSQRVVALAELSDGTFWSDTVDVIVTIAACVEGIP